MLEDGISPLRGLALYFVSAKTTRSHPSVIGRETLIDF
jgi:hypothetical protein